MLCVELLYIAQTQLSHASADEVELTRVPDGFDDLACVCVCVCVCVRVCVRVSDTVLADVGESMQVRAWVWGNKKCHNEPSFPTASGFTTTRVRSSCEPSFAFVNSSA
jgi:hypothetical protein